MSTNLKLPLACSGIWFVAVGLSGLCLSGCGSESLPIPANAYSAPPTKRTDKDSTDTVASVRSTRRTVRVNRVAAGNTRFVADDSPPKTKSAPNQSPSTTTPAPATKPSTKPATGRDSTTTTKGSPRYTTRSKNDPNGIGKFYMDREIARVMGAGAATWLERPEREQEESLTKMVAALKLQPGMVVADIGAGSGVITVMLAEKVGKEGRVVAVDIQQEMLNRLARKVKEKKLENVITVLGTVKTAKLNAGTIDLALMVDVYHEFSFPYEMLSNISQSLKPGGRVVFVEYRREDPAVPIKLVHKMSEAQVKLEASLPEFKLKWKETIGALPWQHMVVFERVADKAGTDSQPAKAP